MKKSSETRKHENAEGRKREHPALFDFHIAMTRNAQAKKKALLDRIKHLKEAIAKGWEYLESGRHASWHGFQPLFDKKVKDGEPVPPHKDWVKNVFLPRRERALRHSEEALEKIIASEKSGHSAAIHPNAVSPP